MNRSSLSRRVRKLERRAGCARCGYPGDPPLDLLTRLPTDRVELMVDVAIEALKADRFGGPGAPRPP